MSKELEVLPPTAVIDNNGVTRDRKTGRILPGSKSLNPKGVGKSQNTFRKQLRKKFGEDGKAFVTYITTVLDYDWAYDKKRNPNKTRPDFDGTHKIKVLELALHYLFGKPSESLHVDQDVDLTIETKMHKIAKLIHDNKDKLRVIEGGGGINQDVIYDDDE